jgi:hypothetical protein
MDIYQFLNKFNDGKVSLFEARMGPDVRQSKKDLERWVGKKNVKGYYQDVKSIGQATGDKATVAAVDSAKRMERAEKLRRIKKLKKAGAIGAGVAGAAGAAYGGYKLAQRLKKRKQCKAQFPNNPEKYKACMKG